MNSSSFIAGKDAKQEHNNTEFIRNAALRRILSVKSKSRKTTTKLFDPYSSDMKIINKKRKTITTTPHIFIPSFRPYKPPTRMIIGATSTHANYTMYLTGGIKSLFKRINNIKYQSKQQQQEEYNIITNKHGHIVINNIKELGRRYLFIEVIGTGTFSILVKAEDLYSSLRPRKHVAIKIMHQQFQYIGKQESVNVRCLNLFDKHLQSHIIKQYESFLLKNTHLCLVFELLDISLLDYIHQIKTTHQSYYSINMNEIRQFTLQITTALQIMKLHHIIHADLKPENILLRRKTQQQQNNNIINHQNNHYQNNNNYINQQQQKEWIIIDFGNSIHTSQLKQYYNDYQAQTLFYRAPEVLLGIPFDCAIDSWSIGCILYEIFTGKPLFAVKSEDELFLKMFKLLGPFPFELYKNAKFKNKYFTSEAYISKVYNPIDRLARVESLAHALGTKVDSDFVMLLTSLLEYNPKERITMIEVLTHPFLNEIFPFSMILNPINNRIREDDDNNNNSSSSSNI